MVQRILTIMGVRMLMVLFDYTQVEDAVCRIASSLKSAFRKDLRFAVFGQHTNCQWVLTQ